MCVEQVIDGSIQLVVYVIIFFVGGAVYGGCLAKGYSVALVLCNDDAKIRSSNLLVAFSFPFSLSTLSSLHSRVYQSFLCFLFSFFFLGCSMDENQSERQCRICLSGVEEEKTSGRLIRPCQCRGSMQVSLGNISDAFHPK